MDGTALKGDKPLRCIHCSQGCERPGGPSAFPVGELDVRLAGFDRDDPKTWSRHYSLTTAQRSLAQVVADIRGYLAYIEGRAPQPGSGITVTDPGINATCGIREDGTVGIDLRPGFWQLSELQQEELLNSIIEGARTQILEQGGRRHA